MSAADDTRMRVSEVFGPTWQGEGPHAGRPVHFLRLGLCNLSCEWCDTPFTWDAKRYDLAATAPTATVAEVAERLLAAGAGEGIVVVSGGEPLIHARQLLVLAEQEVLAGVEWHVETNGTLYAPPWWESRIAHTTVSPKIGTRDVLSKRIKEAPLHRWRALAEQGHAAFKFVARNADEVDGAAAVAERIGLRRELVWIMPEGTNADQVVGTHRLIAPRVAHYGFNTTTRLHTLLWDDERGR